MDFHTQAVNHTQKIQPKDIVQNKDELAKAFLATWRAADQAAEVAQADKKQKEEEQKKRQRVFQKEDFEGYDELEDVLEEIDKRLEKMLDIAKKLDA